MLRGIRWQILALIGSITLFSVVLGMRLLSPTQNDITPTPTPTQLPATATIAPTFTPQPTMISQVENAPDLSTVTEGIVGRVQRLNPILISTQAERDITSLIFDGLIAINEFGEPSPDLASDWVVSRDGYEYVLQLRQDILWQDGSPFTARDVVFTYQLLADDTFPLTELSAFWQTVEIEQLGDYLVRFRLAQPLASFPTLLTDGILPQHALEGITAEQLLNHPFNLTPVGTGVYQLETLRSVNGQQIDGLDLRVAPTFRQREDGQIGYAIDQLQFRFYDTFDVAISDFVAGNIQAIASSTMADRSQMLVLGSANVLTQIEPHVTMLVFNWDEGEETSFFSDLRIRRALQLGLNRENPVLQGLLNQAIVADSPLRPDSWAYNSTLTYPLDPAQAFESLENATITVPEDTDLGDFRYRFSILTIDNATIVGIVDNIAAQWRQFNFDVTVESVSVQQYNERLLSGDFDVAIVDYELGADPDIFAYWHADQHDEGFNYGSVNSTRINELLERGRQTVSEAARINVYRQFQTEFINQVIAIPLYYPLYTYAVDSSVEGVQLGFISSPEDRFRTLHDWVYPSP